MNTHFVFNNNQVRLYSFDENQVKSKLPAGIYYIMYSEIGGYYLQVAKDQKFELPSNFYGDVKNKAERIITTYESRACSTGVLLTGNKGSGKSLLAKLVCNTMIDKGVPVIIVGDDHSDSEFHAFVETLGECVLFFDEFGKIYKGDENQELLLSLFDGNSLNKRLHLVTENLYYNINEYMLNRPGRFFYHLIYDSLPEDIIYDFCNSKDLPSEFTSQLLHEISFFRDFNFDLLQAIVEEYLRYGEDLKTIYQYLNIDKTECIYYEVIKFSTKDQELSVPEKYKFITLKSDRENFCIEYIDKQGNLEHGCFSPTRDFAQQQKNITVFKNKHFEVYLKKITGYQSKNYF